MYLGFQEFMNCCLKIYPNRFVVSLNGNIILYESIIENQWKTVNLLEIDAFLVKLYLIDVNKMEWLYRSSSRIWNIFNKLRRTFVFTFRPIELLWSSHV